MQQRIWVVLLMVASAVGVGAMTWWAWPYMTNISGGITTSNSTTNTNNANTSAWNSYTDRTERFSVDYPKAWKATNCDESGVYFSAPNVDPCGIGNESISIIEGELDGTLAETVDAGKLLYKGTTSTLTIDGTTATRLKGVMPIELSLDETPKEEVVDITYLEKGKKLWTITNAYPNQEVGLQKIFASLKFSAVQTVSTTVKSGALQKTTSLPTAKGLVYLWSADGILHSYLLSNTKLEETFELAVPAGSSMVDVRYNADTDAVAYITRKGQTDSVLYRSTVAADPVTITSHTRPADVTKAVEQAVKYRSVPELRDSTVEVTQAAWEGCSGQVFSLNTKKKLYDEWCGALAVSPDGKRFVTTTANGIATGNSFTTSTTIDGTFAEPNWKEFTGDTKLIYNSTTKKLIAGFSYGFFISNTEFVTFVQSDAGQSFLGLVDFSKKTFTKLVDRKETPRGIAYSNGTLITGSELGLDYYVLSTKQQASVTYPTGWHTPTDFNNRVVGAVGNTAIVVAQSGYNEAKSQYTKKEIVAVDMQKNAYLVLSSTGTDVFAAVAGE
jgi:hypothetical protein